jgi:hypothetical protein
LWNSPEVKVIRGVAGIVGGFTTATGGGVVGTLLNLSGMGRAAVTVGKKTGRNGCKIVRRRDERD